MARTHRAHGCGCCPPPFLPVHQDHGPNHLQPFGSGPFDGLDGGAAGGGHIVDDHHLLAGLDVPFDPFDDAVVLLVFRMEKAFTGWPRNSEAKAVAMAMGSAPKVSPPTAGDPLSCMASNIRWPVRNMPRGLKVVGLQLT
jgi:hypothetical protein